MIGSGQCRFEFGDVDGDGDADLVVVTSNSLLVRSNDGTGGFGTVLQSLSTGFASSYHRPNLADLDGDLDLVANREVWKNDGNGKFSSTGQSFDRDTRAVAAFDLEGDGDLDLVLGNYDQENDLYVNDGTGAFVKSDGYQTLAWCTTDLGLVDLDEDGDLDLIEGNLTATSIVWLNEDGVLTEADYTKGWHGYGTIISRVVAGDLDGDGDEDFVTLPMPAEAFWSPRLYRND